MTKTVAVLNMGQERPALHLVVRPKRLALPDERPTRPSWAELLFAGVCLTFALSTLWAAFTPPVLP